MPAATSGDRVQEAVPGGTHRLRALSVVGVTIHLGAEGRRPAVTWITAGLIGADQRLVPLDVNACRQPDPTRGRLTTRRYKTRTIPLVRGTLAVLCNRPRR